MVREEWEGVGCGEGGGRGEWMREGRETRERGGKGERE